MGIRTAAWALLAVTAGGVGYLAGSREGQQATIRALQTEAAGNLSQRIEALSLLRLGDVSGAIARLEDEADQLTRTIASNPGSDRRVLAAAKTYLSAAPPSPSREKELAGALEGVPALDPSQCSTALKQLLLSVQAEPAERR